MTPATYSPKLAICFILEYYYPHVGGGEVLFQKLAEGLVKEGHRCDVVTCRIPGTKKFEVVNGVNIYRVRVPGCADRYWFTFMSIPLAWKIAKRADIIHTMTYNGAFPAWLIAGMRKKPVVITIHEVLGKKWMELNFNFLAAFSCRLIENTILHLPYDGYSCNSKNTMNCLTDWGIDSKKAFLAYPGIDNQLFKPKPDEEAKKIRRKLGIKDSTFLYSYYGRPGMVKGLEYLIRAVPLIKKEIFDSKLLLILSKDPPTKYREMEHLIRTMKLDNVIVHDSIPREVLPCYIQATDCVVVPSLNEGFGFTCVEACTMGKPVVASNVGSIPEVIFGRYVLVPPRDPEALADGVVKTFREKYETGEQKMYRWDNTVQKHLEAYREIILNREMAISQKAPSPRQVRVIMERNPGTEKERINPRGHDPI
ncbi:MAG: glycosyltransferase family 4 protein [Syntrophales bacterium]|nr:glycosyltransferase family 4 protein [Syntrophales bacterium]